MALLLGQAGTGDLAAGIHDPAGPRLAEVVARRLGARHRLADCLTGQVKLAADPPDRPTLDDFSMREYLVLQAEDLYELVSRHYRRGSLILTTHREPKDLHPLFPNAVLAEGLLDQLLNSAYVITMLGRATGRGSGQTSR